MLVGNFITDEIPPLKTTDTVEMALDWMEQFKVSHLAVVENKNLIGLVSENELMDYDHPEETISKGKINFIRPVLYDHQHTYDLVKLMASLNLSLVPVIDEKEQYKGCITLKGVIQNLSEKGLLTNSLVHHFIQMSLDYKEFNLFENILKTAKLSFANQIKWQLFYAFLPLRLYLYRIKNKIVS